MIRRCAVAVLVVGVLAGGVAACGGDDAAVGGAAAGAGADQAGGGTGAAGGGAGGCREVEHELGTACVPIEPQRIVTLDSLTVLPTLVELGMPVAGALSVYPAGEPFPAYLDPEATEGIEIVGDMQTPNLEAIAALRPDLIVGALPLVEPLQDELERIPP